MKARYVLKEIFVKDVYSHKTKNSYLPKSVSQSLKFGEISQTIAVHKPDALPHR